MHRVRLVVSGRVQGVGFRHFIRRLAQELEIAGSVRNRADGGVEVEAEGERAALERLIEEARMGPTAARVEHVDVVWSEGPGKHRDFAVTG